MISRKTRDYIEDELFRYHDYKEELAEIRKSVLMDSPPPDSGQPKRRLPADSTADKAIALVAGVCTGHIERFTKAVDRALNKLGSAHKMFFDLIYVQKRELRKEKTYICDVELNISVKTFYNRKQDIIAQVARELGILQ